MTGPLSPDLTHPAAQSTSLHSSPSTPHTPGALRPHLPCWVFAHMHTSLPLLLSGHGHLLREDWEIQNCPPRIAALLLLQRLSPLFTVSHWQTRPPHASSMGMKTLFYSVAYSQHPPLSRYSKLLSEG
jgi:hypothetical protein